MNNMSNTRRRGNATRQSGYTLLELVASSVMATVLMAGLSSAIVIATQAVSIPAEQKSTMDAAEASFVVADDLHEAIHVLDHSDSLFSVVVGDRDDDQEEETITWEFPPESELTRTTAVGSGALLASLSSVTFTPRYRSVAESLGEVVSESPEAQLTGMSSATNAYQWTIKSDRSLGQFVDLTHPSDCILWSVSELKLVLRRSSSYNATEKLMIRIHEAGSDGLPTSSILAEAEVPLTSLTTSWQWVTVPISVERLLPTRNVCVILTTDESGHDNCHAYYGRYGFTSTGMLLRNYSHDFVFTTSTTRNLYYSLSGTRHTIDGTTHTITRNYFAGCDLSIQASASATPIRRNVRLMNTPEDVNNILRLDFDSDPTGDIDVNHDGIDDWQATGAASVMTDISDSQMTMTSGTGIQNTQTADFNGVLTVNAHLQPATVTESDGGALLTIPFQDSSRWGQVALQIRKADNNLLTATVTAQTDSDDQLVAKATGLPDQLTEVRIVIDPSAAQAAVWFNDYFQGRTTVSLPLTTHSQRVGLEAVNTNVLCDFLSVRESRK